MFSEKLTTRPLSSRWLLLALTVGLALAVALSMAFAGDAEAKQKKNKSKAPTTSLSAPTTPESTPEQPPAMGDSATQPEMSSSAAASTISVKTCSGGTIQLNTDEKKTLDLHNQARSTNKLPVLCVHPALTNAARSHSQEMLAKGYFSHNSYNGETDKARLERFGYTSSGYSFWRYGENIYWGSGTSGSPDSAFKWWMNSSGHKANILNKDFREVGIGVQTGTYKGYANTKMYTVDFGVRR